MMSDAKALGMTHLAMTLTPNTAHRLNILPMRTHHAPSVAPDL